MKGRKMPYVKGLITVIVPTLNCAMSIDRCVESILNQTWKELEVVCVDACSTDGTKELLQKYEEKDKRVKVIVSDRKSYGYQMNLGISCASGEYIGIVESDDEVEPDMYEQLYSAAILYTPDMVRSDYCETYIGENGVRDLFQSSMIRASMTNALELRIMCIASIRMLLQPGADCIEGIF